MAKKDTKATGSKSGDRKAVTSDPRFAAVHNDPRFSLPKRRQVKSNIDARFKVALEADERFKDKTKVDRYGRKVTQNKGLRELDRYYNLDTSDTSEDSSDEVPDNEKSASSKQIPSESSDDSDSDSDSEDISDDEVAVVTTSFVDRARGEGPQESSSDDNSSESDSSDDDEEEEEEEEEFGVAGNDVELGDETDTLAVVNMDWDNVRAVDLMAAFSSFVPAHKRILWVKIFPSEYGKKRMAEEDIHGPSKEFFEEKKNKSKDSDSDEEINEQTIVQEDKGEEVDSKKLRRYQLQRMQYYYAVVKCDSVVTAKNIYDNCDGAEYESSANIFDLRYVPTDMVFDDDPRDTAVKIPAGYRPNQFVTDSLQHSKVKLTWDETPTERAQVVSRAFSQREIDDMDYKAYLASDSESDGEEQAAEKYRALLEGIEFGSKNKNEKDMEITFTPGLDDAGDEDISDTVDIEENTIDKYRRKEKERRKRRMEKIKAAREAENGDKNSKPGQGGVRNAEESKNAAELELLLMDDDLTAAPKNIVDVGKSEQGNKQAKGKRGLSKKQQRLEELEAGFDAADPRFQGLYSDPQFAIDTTAPQFKKTKAMERVMTERHRRAAKTESAPKNEPSSKKRKAVTQKDDSLESLVDKIKRKARKV